MSDTGIGAAVLRKEDFRLLTGRGSYTDDINRPGSRPLRWTCTASQPPSARFELV